MHTATPNFNSLAPFWIIMIKLNLRLARIRNEKTVVLQYTPIYSLDYTFFSLTQSCAPRCILISTICFRASLWSYWLCLFFIVYKFWNRNKVIEDHNLKIALCIVGLNIVYGSYRGLLLYNYDNTFLYRTSIPLFKSQ